MPANGAWKRNRMWRLWLCRPVAEKFLAFAPQESAKYRNTVIALLKNQPARDQARSPLIIFGAVRAPILGDVFLRHTVHHCADSRPHAGPRAHRARLVRRVKDEVGQVAPIAARH